MNVYIDPAMKANYLADLNQKIREHFNRSGEIIPMDRFACELHEGEVAIVARSPSGDVLFRSVLFGLAPMLYGGDGNA